MGVLFSTALGALMVILLGGLSVLLMQRTIRQREAAQNELETMNENLERIVEHRTADLQEANAEIQRFAYIVSHDLRSPLVNIMGFTTELEAFRRSIFNEIERLQADVSKLGSDVKSADTATLATEFDEAISFIKSSITRMDRLINAILRLSREGRREFKPERLDMTELVQAIESSMAHQATAVGATISVGRLPEITSDRVALEQVFSNLIDNALKYLRPDEPGKIEVSGQENPGYMVYEVKDNGRGIDTGDHSRVFELFRRAGPQDRPGEGIGLAHVRALVRRLGGTVTLSSELGKGSVFRVVLPRRWIDQDKRNAA
jgi:signal transduction histidine kinase